MSKLTYLYNLHDRYNAEEFGNKLNPVKILLKKNRHKDGWFEYETQRRKCEGKGRGSNWYPRRDRLHKAHIIICDGCWDEGTVDATLLHEMIHQYQVEVLDRPTSHDAIFCSMARRLERKYRMKVR
jgi:hypothetical protein